MKTILVHVNGTHSDLSVLAGALSIARLFNAHLHCLHTVPDRRVLLGRAVNVDLSSAMLLTDALRTLEAEAEKRLAHARDIFLAFCEDKRLAIRDAPNDADGVSASWHEHSGNPVAALIEQSRFHDLLVIEGGARRDLLFSGNDVGDIVIGAGRPVFLAPAHAHVGVKSVAVAWKNCAEAARAVTAALPLLKKAEKILAFSANEPGSDPESVAQSLDSMTQYLAWHGLRVEGFCVAPGSRAVPDAVLETAAEARAELLVMGGFGHGRLREFVFGGFTQRVLDGAPLPVLLVH